MKNRIFLGYTKDGIVTDGFHLGKEGIFVEKHEWACGWYWGFGYIGNKNMHFHFKSLLKGSLLASELFVNPTFSDEDWWVIRDLFKQAYALQAAAEAYQYGGHQTSRPGVTDILKSPEKAAILNADLKLILDMVWEFMGGNK